MSFKATDEWFFPLHLTSWSSSYRKIISGGALDGIRESAERGLPALSSSPAPDAVSRARTSSETESAVRCRGPAVRHVTIVIFLEFFAWGLIATILPEVSVVIFHQPPDLLQLATCSRVVADTRVLQNNKKTICRLWSTPGPSLDSV